MAYRTYAQTNGFLVAQDGTGDFFNISSACAAAAAVNGVTIFVRDGVYTENFTLPPDTILTSYDSLDYRASGVIPTVTIQGTITCNYSGTSAISGIRLQTNNNFCLLVNGSNPTVLNLSEVYFDCLNNTGISYTNTNPSAYITCLYSTGAISSSGVAFFASTSAGSLRFEYFTGENIVASNAINTFSNGSLFVFYSSFDQGISLTSAGANFLYSVISSTRSAINQIALSLSTSGTYNSTNCWFNSGTASAISIGAGTNFSILQGIITSTNSNVITGAGTLLTSGISFTNNSTINTTNQVLQTFSPGARNIVSPSGNYTVVNTDSIVFVNTSSPKTITLPSSPSFGEEHIISDIVGSAATNNITVSGGGFSILGSTTASTYVMVNNGQSDTFVFSGSLWKVM